MSSIRYPTPKFAVGDPVIADGDIARVTDVTNAPDSEFEKWYGVEWETGEWGTFDEDELSSISVPVENNS